MFSDAESSVRFDALAPMKHKVMEPGSNPINANEYAQSGIAVIPLM
jgi:hypothetical protein